ncbi:MAG: hypothetical protein HY774_18285 [Acidobacteria bacterium]|nr:hypothetical protein [Acidobacteriota bacterium]
MNQPETSGRKMIQFLACAMMLSFFLEFCSGLDLTQSFGSSAQFQMAAVEVPVSASETEMPSLETPTRTDASAASVSLPSKAKSAARITRKPAKRTESLPDFNPDHIALVETNLETQLLKNIIQTAGSKKSSELALAKCVTQYALAKCSTELSGVERVKAIKVLKATNVLIQTANPDFSKMISIRPIKAIAPLIKLKSTKC